MQAILERRDDSEVAATAAQPPEQVRVFALARFDEPAIGRHHVRGNEVVADEAELPHQPADAAAEGDSADPRHRDGTAGGRQPERLRLVVKIAQERAALGTRSRAPRDRRGRCACRERSITSPPSTTALPAALCPPPRTATCSPCSRAKFTQAITSATPRAARDHRRMLVAHRVPDAARGVVFGVSGLDELSS